MKSPENAFMRQPKATEGRIRARAARDFGQALSNAMERYHRNLCVRLVHVGGMEPGLVPRPGKIKHLDLTGMDDGHTETSQSGVD